MEAQKAAFMGRITAGVTHEMKNVLATIRETSGLLSDLLTYGDAKNIPQREKFLSTLDIVQEQVNRGVAMMTMLNGFAHRPDAAVGSFDLKPLLDQFAALSGRFARLKGATIAVNGAGAVTIVADPMLLMVALFSCLELSLAKVKSGGSIRFTLSERESEAAIAMEWDGDTEAHVREASESAVSEAWLKALEIVVGMGGNLELSAEVPRVTMRLPRGGSYVS